MIFFVRTQILLIQEKQVQLDFWRIKMMTMRNTYGKFSRMSVKTNVNCMFKICWIRYVWFFVVYFASFYSKGFSFGTFLFFLITIRFLWQRFHVKRNIRG